MSSYLNCCTTDYSRNSTNIREFLYYYTPDGVNYPYRSCAVDLAGNAIPLSRTATENDCYPDRYNVPACGTNGMGKGAWPAPFPTQTFEKLSILRNVSFTYSGTEITAYYLGHGLKVGNETFTISNQSGTNAVLNGSWTVASIYNANTFKFNVSTAPTAALNNADLDFRQQIDFCKSKGFKVVHAKKLWNGRYGFQSDYIANPKVSSKFKKYNVSITETEEASGSYKYESGAGISIDSWSFGGTIGGSSNQLLTIGGVRDCYGSTQGNPGNFNYRVVTDGTQTYYVDCQNDESPTISNNIYANVCGFPEIAPTWNTQQVKEFCGIDGNRGIVTCVVPVGGTTIDNLEGWSEYKYMILTAAKTSYVGTPENFQTFLSAFDQNIPFSDFHPYPETPGFEDVVINGSLTITNTGTITLSETGIHVVVKISSAVYTVYSHPSVGVIKTGDAYLKTSFDGTATLSQEYTAGACEAEAQSLLSQWDMTNDSVYPWRTDGNCGVAPMVIIKETTGGIGFGYCDTHADISLLTAYDGSIYGKPLAAGYYNKGWFDFIEDEYHYTDDGFGTGT
ncbi:MAG: hypothetical protein EBU33_03220, partial [Sphingobacteriia bacterium]|nr:hypothetical protein [Sphingobacteriia bacterium]